MFDFRKLAHLAEQLGGERFAALIDSGNTGKVREFCDGLVKDAIPTAITIGERTYDILGFLEEDETSVIGTTMVERAKKMSANLGEDDGRYFLDHQDDIPAALRGKVVFVFTDWRHPVNPGFVACVRWLGDRWVQNWGWLGLVWYGNDRVPRRK